MENPVERDFWIFVDIGCEPPMFYIVPAWWIANDIYEIHQKVLEIAWWPSQDSMTTPTIMDFVEAHSGLGGVLGAVGAIERF